MSWAPEVFNPVHHHADRIISQILIPTPTGRRRIREPSLPEETIRPFQLYTTSQSRLDRTSVSHLYEIGAALRYSNRQHNKTRTLDALSIRDPTLETIDEKERR